MNILFTQYYVLIKTYMMFIYVCGKKMAVQYLAVFLCVTF